MAKAAYFSEGDGDEGRAECWGLSVVAASPVPPEAAWATGGSWRMEDSLKTLCWS